MAKFCAKCGSELKEGTKFCTKCGNPVQENAEMNQQSKERPVMPVITGTVNNGKKLNFKAMKSIAMIAIPVILIVAIFLGISGSKGYEKPIKYLEEGVNERDLNTLMKAFPKDLEAVANTLAKGADDLISSDFITESLMDNLFDIEGEIDLEIIGKEKLDKKEILSVLSDEYDIPPMQLKDVKEAYILDVDATIKFEGEEDSDDMQIPVVKQDGKWIIPIPSMF